ncbi:MAG TPA: response regulator [Candidatus Polarisedimenticolia bacterium]|nr:response regulator [Candidatus Polarisedimenticolia bacterium]
MKPVALIDDDIRPGEAGEPEALRGFSREHRRILVVDDEEVILDLVSDALQARRYQVDLARSCKEALPQILFRDYSGIVLDIALPDSNGLFLYRQIVRRRPALGARVVFVTGALEKAAAKLFARLAHRRVLLKPFDLDELIEAIGDVTGPPVQRGPAGYGPQGLVPRR